MENLFPPGFWRTTALLGMLVFFALGVDLMLGARFITFLNHLFNRKFHVDEAIVQALTEFKRKSDKEFDLDKSLMRGWGRFVMSGLLIFGGALIFMMLLPNL